MKVLCHFSTLGSSHDIHGMMTYTLKGSRESLVMFSSDGKVSGSIDATFLPSFYLRRLMGRFI